MRQRIPQEDKPQQSVGSEQSTFDLIRVEAEDSEGVWTVRTSDPIEAKDSARGQTSAISW